MDAGLKGITGDLFGARAAPRAPAPTSPAPAKAPPRTVNPTSTTRARTPRATTVAHKLPAFYHRLPLQAQRRYLASDVIDRFPLTPQAP